MIKIGVLDQYGFYSVCYKELTILNAIIRYDPFQDSTSYRF